MILKMELHDGEITCRKDGVLFVVGRDAKLRVMAEYSTVGLEREYMITGVLGTHAKGLIVEPVTQEHVLIEHGGFECAGTMCSTTARSSTKWCGFLTPGRVMDIVWTADNVNVGWDGQKHKPPRPSKAYVVRGSVVLAACQA